jgi:hypothetical protein
MGVEELVSAVAAVGVRIAGTVAAASPVLDEAATFG